MSDNNSYLDARRSFKYLNNKNLSFFNMENPYNLLIICIISYEDG